MKPTKKMPYIVIIETTDCTASFAYASREQAKMALEIFRSMGLKVSMVTSIKKGKKK